MYTCVTMFKLTVRVQTYALLGKLTIQEWRLNTSCLQHETLKGESWLTSEVLVRGPCQMSWRFFLLRQNALNIEFPILVDLPFFGSELLSDLDGR